MSSKPASEGAPAALAPGDEELGAAAGGGPVGQPLSVDLAKPEPLRKSELPLSEVSQVLLIPLVVVAAFMVRRGRDPAAPDKPAPRVAGTGQRRRRRGVRVYVRRPRARVGRRRAHQHRGGVHGQRAQPARQPGRRGRRRRGRRLRHRRGLVNDWRAAFLSNFIPAAAAFVACLLTLERKRFWVRAMVVPLLRLSLIVVIQVSIWTAAALVNYHVNEAGTEVERQAWVVSLFVYKTALREAMLNWVPDDWGPMCSPVAPVKRRWCFAAETAYELGMVLALAQTAQLVTLVINIPITVVSLYSPLMIHVGRGALAPAARRVSGSAPVHAGYEPEPKAEASADSVRTFRVRRMQCVTRGVLVRTTVCVVCLPLLLLARYGPNAHFTPYNEDALAQGDFDQAMLFTVGYMALVWLVAAPADRIYRRCWGMSPLDMLHEIRGTRCYAASMLATGFAIQTVYPHWGL